LIKLYEINNLEEIIFLDRPNRFVAKIKVHEEESLAHVHDPGRLKELLIPNCRVLVKKGTGKLPYYIQAVFSEGEWILLDSAQQSKIAKKLFEILEDFRNIKEIKSEVKLDNSRIDFTLDGVPLECKGVSLVINNVALFPDAPTKRGTRHIEEIIKNNGIIMFIIFKKANKFIPNYEMDRQFSEKLSEARKKNIKIICVQIYFDGKNVFFKNKVPLGDF